MVRVANNSQRLLPANTNPCTTQRRRVALREMQRVTHINTSRANRLNNISPSTRRHENVIDTLGRPLEHRVVARVHTDLRAPFDHNCLAHDHGNTDRGSKGSRPARRSTSNAACRPKPNALRSCDVK